MSDKKQPPADEPEIEILVNPAENVLGGGTIRGEVYGCPTGLSRASRAPKKEEPSDAPKGGPPKGEPRNG